MQRTMMFKVLLDNKYIYLAVHGKLFHTKLAFYDKELKVFVLHTPRITFNIGRVK